MKPKPSTEKSIMLGIMSALGMRGWRIRRMPPAIYAKAGLPDLKCTRWGVTAWIEVKGPKGKLSPGQIQFGQEEDDAGGIYVVARSVDFAVQVLENIEIVMCDKNGNTSASIRPQKGMRLMSNGKS